MATTIMVAMRQPLRLRCTTVNRHHIVMGAVALVITHTVLLRTLLGHHNNINTGKGTDPGPTHRRPRIAGTLTRMAVGETHHGRCLVRTVGAGITLGPRAEGDMVEVVGGDIIVVAVMGVVVMEAAEEGLAAPLYIRAATILVSTMADIAQAVEAHREDAVAVEATKVLVWARPLLLLLFIVFCLYAYRNLNPRSDSLHYMQLDFRSQPGYAISRILYKLHCISIPVFIFKKKSRSVDARTCTAPGSRHQGHSILRFSMSPINMGHQGIRHAG